MAKQPPGPLYVIPRRTFSGTVLTVGAENLKPETLQDHINLVSAAPLMFKALKQAKDALYAAGTELDWEMFEDAYNEVNAAIEKAEGD